jgi:prephenate dehydrogenase
MESVAIVGTGLIGASFGLALREAGFEGAILGVSSPRALEAALGRGAIDRAASLEEAAGEAGLIFLAQPIGRILDTIRRLDPLVRPEALVTDAGSTKCEIVDTARQHLRRCQFLGGHPMAGKASRGAEVADGALFRDRTWALSPDEPAELETPAARDFTGWLERIGARVVSIEADEHDRVVSLTSHLPQLLSTALAGVVAERIGAPGNLAIAGPGLADTTRLALSSYELWRDIVATNSEHIDRSLAACIQKLEHIRENLRTRQLQEEFERGARLAAKIPRPSR